MPYKGMLLKVTENFDSTSRLQQNFLTCRAQSERKQDFFFFNAVNLTTVTIICVRSFWEEIAYGASIHNVPVYLILNFS